MGKPSKAASSQGRQVEVIASKAGSEPVAASGSDYSSPDFGD
jgi:hypothetical protein